MLFFLYQRSLQTDLPPYWSAGGGVSAGLRTLPSYVINAEAFHTALFSNSNNGEKTRIKLPNHQSEMTEFEIEETPLFSMKTLQKYKNELYSFKGVSTSNSDYKIGIVWCFKMLKVYYIDQYQTLEPVNKFGEYFVFDRKKYTVSRRLKEENISNLMEDLHIDKIIHESNSNSNDIFKPTDNPKISHISELMNSVKIIRFLPFPTCDMIQKILTNRGVPTYGFSDDDKKKIIFVQLAASMHYVNLIFLPEVSIRFEMVFDLNLVLLQKTTDNVNKYALNPNSRKLTPSAKMATFVNQYIDDEDIDLAQLVHLGTEAGETRLKMLKPFQPDKYRGITTDEFMNFGSFETVFCHEIAHQLGAPHTYSYKSDSTRTAVEPGTGVTIMGYPGLGDKSNVESGRSPFF